MGFFWWLEGRVKCIMRRRGGTAVCSEESGATAAGMARYSFGRRCQFFAQKVL